MNPLATIEVNVPAKIKEFLMWEYGQCVDIGPHIWPWQTLLYTIPSKRLSGAVALLASTARAKVRSSNMSKTHSPFLRVIPVLLSFYLFETGLATWLVLILCMLDFFMVTNRSRFPRTRGRVLNLALVLIATYDLRETWYQLYCHFDGQYINAWRPRTWTICVGGYCHDFT